MYPISDSLAAPCLVCTLDRCPARASYPLCYPLGTVGVLFTFFLEKRARCHKGEGLGALDESIFRKMAPLSRGNRPGVPWMNGEKMALSCSWSLWCIWVSVGFVAVTKFLFGVSARFSTAEWFSFRCRQPSGSCQVTASRPTSAPSQGSWLRRAINSRSPRPCRTPWKRPIPASSR